MAKQFATFSFNEDDTFIIMESLHSIFKARMLAREKAHAMGFDCKVHMKHAFTMARITMEFDRVIHEMKWCKDPECHFKENVEDFRKMFKTELAEIAMQNNGNGK
jgi:hypothetical protein